MTTKKAVTLAIIIAAPIGFWFCHFIGYGSGYLEGYSKGPRLGWIPVGFTGLEGHSD